jgi:hypothetical protein
MQPLYDLADTAFADTAFADTVFPVGQVMPVRAWVDEGALIAAGSDCNVSFFDPLLSIWGLVTRGTRTVGVQGPEFRVDTYTAIRLYTAATGGGAAVACSAPRTVRTVSTVRPAGPARPVWRRSGPRALPRRCDIVVARATTMSHRRGSAGCGRGPGGRGSAGPAAPR